MNIECNLKYLLKLLLVMELDGTKWYSEIGSYMVLKADGNGNLTGTYYTSPGKMSAPLSGRYDPTGGSAFGWTVSWPKDQYPSNSTTSWAANITTINQVPTIKSSWMIREQLAENKYDSTVCGCENYTQTPPSEETLNANKEKRPSHPL